MGQAQRADSAQDSQRDRHIFALRERILRGEFAPGEHLTELGLVPLLGASRTPIRLALERLSHDGLLERIPSGGFRVCSFSIGDVLDVIELRGVLEGTAARFAAERLEAVEELEPLKSLLAEARLSMPISMDTFAEYLDANDRFHRELWCLAKSRPLLRALEAAVKVPFAKPGSLVFTNADREPATALIAAEQHRAIVEAIEHREGARAEALAREHSRLARRNLKVALDRKDVAGQALGAALITR
jgi:GntR family transcriptional regulator of vanillate catabolism